MRRACGETIRNNLWQSSARVLRHGRLGRGPTMSHASRSRARDPLLASIGRHAPLWSVRRRSTCQSTVTSSSSPSRLLLALVPFPQQSSPGRQATAGRRRSLQGLRTRFSRMTQCALFTHMLDPTSAACFRALQPCRPGVKAGPRVRLPGSPERALKHMVAGPRRTYHVSGPRARSVCTGTNGSLLPRLRQASMWQSSLKVRSPSPPGGHSLRNCQTKGSSSWLVELATFGCTLTANVNQRERQRTADS